MEAALSNYAEKVKILDEKYEQMGDAKFEKGSGYKDYERARAFFDQRVDNNGEMGKYMEALKKYQSKLKNTPSPKTPLPPWTFFGPVGIPPHPVETYGSPGATGKGWVNCVAVNPQDINEIYVGSHHGGVFYTSDGGDHWVAKNDHDPLINGIVGMAVDFASNKIYVATGLSFSNFNYSNGVFKSTDGGTTWTDINNGDIAGVYPNEYYGNAPRKLVMDPDNSNVVYLVTQSDIYKTTDGGSNWDCIMENSFWWWWRRKEDMYAAGIDTGCFTKNTGPCFGYETSDTCIINYCCYSDPAIISAVKDCPHLEFGWYDFEIGKTSNGQKVLIACGHKAFISENEGITWIDVTHEVLETFTDPDYGGPLTQVQRMEVAINNDIYPGEAWFGFTDESQLHVTSFNLDTRSNIYQVKNISDAVGWSKDKAKIEVSPTDTSNDGKPIIYAGGLGFSRVNLQNATLNLISTRSYSYYTHYGYNGPGPWVHADIRDIQVMNVNGKDRIFLGHDGGISWGEEDPYCNTTGWCWSNFADDGSSGLQVTEIYGMGGSETNPDLLVAGTQDLSTFKRGYSTTETWQHILYGDGARGNVIDYTDNDIFYFTGYLYDDIVRTLDGGSNFSLSPTHDIHPYSQILMHPENPEILFLGTKMELVRFNDPRNNLLNRTLMLNGNYIIGVEISYSNPDVLYVSSKKRYSWADNPTTFTECIWKTNDCTGTSPQWTDISAGIEGLKGGYVNCIGVNPRDENELWIGLCGTENYPKVYHSVNGGSSWVAFDNGLPSGIPVSDIEVDYMGRIFLASDVGVFYRDRNSSSWSEYRPYRIPNKVFTDIEINHLSGQILAASFGRGIWRNTLPDNYCYDRNAWEISSYTLLDDVNSNCSDIILKSGGQLHVTDSLKMSTPARIIVRNGGILKIDNGIITNADIMVESGGELNVINNGVIQRGLWDEIELKYGAIGNINYGEIKQ